MMCGVAKTTPTILNARADRPHCRTQLTSCFVCKGSSSSTPSSDCLTCCAVAMLAVFPGCSPASDRLPCEDSTSPDVNVGTAATLRVGFTSMAALQYAAGSARRHRECETFKTKLEFLSKRMDWICPSSSNVQFSQHCFALHCSALLCIALHCFALPCFALLYFESIRRKHMFIVVDSIGG